jgi:hypothetical protein
MRTGRSWASVFVADGTKGPTTAEPFPCGRRDTCGASSKGVGRPWEGSAEKDAKNRNSAVLAE